MEKNRSVTVIFISLLIIVILGMSSVVHAESNKRYYFIATDGVIDPENNYQLFTDSWTGEGLEERIVIFEWYANYKGNIVSTASQGWKVGGVKAECKVYSSGNDIFLYLRLYKGGYSSPKISETIVWQIINGKDSTNDRFTSVLTSIDSGKISKTISLNIGEGDIVGLPYSSSYSCRMWLI